MKNKLMKSLPYILVTVIAVILIIFDIAKNVERGISEYDDLDLWAKSLVESSEVMFNDKIYHGVYDTEEIMEAPEGFVVVGSIIECIEDGVELTKNFTSHVLQPGYKVYANPNDDSVILVKITEDEEEFQSFLPYFLEVEGTTENMLNNIIIE